MRLLLITPGEGRNRFHNTETKRRSPREAELSPSPKHSLPSIEMPGKERFPHTVFIRRLPGCLSDFQFRQGTSLNPTAS